MSRYWLDRIESRCVSEETRARIGRAVYALATVLAGMASTATAQGQDEVPAVETAAPVAVVADFTTPVLPGGATTEIIVKRPVTDFVGSPQGEIRWLAPDAPPDGSGDPQKLPILSAAADEQNNLETVLTVSVPPTPDSWPPWQPARVELSANLAPGGDRGAVAEQILLADVRRVSVAWFPLTVTLFTVAVIYPGCAMFVWHLQRRRYKAATQRVPPERVPGPAGFWETLDPVQLTAGALGRASLSKLQIFAFSLIVFGLLLFFQLRHGLLAGLSEDILYLLGISAIGAAAGKFTAILKRRLSLDNWVWLRRKGWLAEGEDVASRARWRDLITDGKEFDVYSFQMAIFSLIVAVALLTTSLSGLAEFEIPDELLALLGISQVVYIGGKAINPSSPAELDEKLNEVRNLERSFRVAAVTAAKDPAVEVTALKEYQDFKGAVVQAAEMFAVIYGKRIETPDQLEPEATGVAT
jgi:hypothetical protein